MEDLLQLEKETIYKQMTKVDIFTKDIQAQQLHNHSFQQALELGK